MLFVALAGYFKARADNEVRQNRIAHTWLNKWKLYNGKPVKAIEAPKYYFGLYKPAFVEAFPFSSTLLVSFTDNWHLYNSLMLYSLCIATAWHMVGPFVLVLAYAVALKILLNLVFQLFFA